jgi:predicted Zn-dependent protease
VAEDKNDDLIIFEDDELEESHENLVDKTEELLLEDDDSNDKVLHLIIIILIALIGIVILAVLYFAFIKPKNQEEQQNKTEKIIESIQNKKITKNNEKKITSLLQKADELYKNGHKEEALKIYEEISTYNKAISLFNIGVAQMQEKNFSQAIKSFEHSYLNEKLKFQSALNIAISAFHLKDQNLFNKYLNISISLLPSKQSAPLYSYYHALVDYYRGFFPEALVAFKNQSSKFYQDEQNLFAAKIETALNNDKEAIKYLEKIQTDENSFSLGLLYAKIGEYDISTTYLKSALKTAKDPLKIKMALALVYNKKGDFAQSAKILLELNKKYKSDAAEVYPIKVELKESLFDPIKAQKNFLNELFFDDRYRFGLIFYYAPYKTINSQQSEKKIQKGVMDLYVDQSIEALNILNNSKNLSDTNIDITKGIKEAIKSKVVKANEIFKRGLEKYPSSSTLHYNIALSYANMFNFKKAYEHFNKSYILDSHNLFARVFSSMCAKLINKKEDNKQIEKIYNSLHFSDDIEYKNRVLSLLSILKNDLFVNLEPNQKENSIFDDILATLFSQMRGDKVLYKKYVSSLKKKTPNDIITNILYIDANFDKQDIKKYAQKIQMLLRANSLNYNPLFYGGSLTKELYIKMLNIAGITNYAKIVLEDYKSQNKETISLLQSEAYVDIYRKNFQNSYNIYNKLIDTYKQDDSNTLFLASIAAIGANHNANAIALLELSKLNDSSNNESRFALGILYQEAKNLEGAAIQYNKIGDIGFKSNYFDFKLDN